MLRVYIACEFGRKDEAKAVAVELRREGITVVSTWHDKDSSYMTGNVNAKAMRDFMQVMECDVLLYLQGTSINANCELGIALGSKKHVLLVGQSCGNIFTMLPWVDQVITCEQAVKVLANLYEGILQ